MPGGIAILKNWLLIAVFTKACELIVLLGCFDLIWFCKYQAFVFRSIVITNLLTSMGSKEFLDIVKPYNFTEI